MMYGTRKELNKKLKRMFGNDEHFALLVWTKQDLMAQVENMTESEAAAILQEIGSVTGHTEEGVSFRTVQEMYAGLRADIATVIVPADLLARLTDVAGLALDAEDARAWPLDVTDRPARSDGAILPVQYTERTTMNNDTLNALILRHGDNLLRRSGWPDSVGMTPVAPETVPGWLFASGVLDADEILALTTRLCQALNDGRAKLLTASAQRLAGTPARLHLYPAQSYPRPEALTDFTCISLPYAREWLTKAECGDLLAFLKDFIDRICDIVRQDAKRIAAALVPSAAPRLMEKRFGVWRLVADEYGHDNWLDSEDEERLDQVLDGILVRGARFCPVLLTLVNESREEIEAAGVMTDLLRFPGEPVRRWFDRRVLRDVLNEVRNTDPIGD